MDLKSLDTAVACSNGAEIELEHPVTEAGLGQFISILGSDSKEFQNYMTRVGNEARRKEFAAKRKGKIVEPETVEASKAEATALLVAMTTGWRGIEYDGVVDWPFNATNAAKLYDELVFVRRQVDAAIVDLENFMPG